jgi:hypothetical protein
MVGSMPRDGSMLPSDVQSTTRLSCSHERPGGDLHRYHAAEQKDHDSSLHQALVSRVFAFLAGERPIADFDRRPYRRALHALMLTYIPGVFTSNSML